jgi:hypothetical protein
VLSCGSRALFVLVRSLASSLSLVSCGSTDDQPVSAGWQGDRLVALNARGKVCRVVEREMRRPEPIEPATADGKGARLTVRDLDRDGKNEIVAVYGSAEGSNDRLAAYDRGGRPLWNLSASTFGFPEGRGVPGLEWFASYRSSGGNGSVDLRDPAARAAFRSSIGSTERRGGRSDARMRGEIEERSAREERRQGRASSRGNVRGASSRFSRSCALESIRGTMTAAPAAPLDDPPRSGGSCRHDRPGTGLFEPPAGR